MPLSWVNILHLYQPPFQAENVVAAVHRESYAWVANTLLKNKRGRCSINITASLLEFLDRSANGRETIRVFRRLIERGQVELLGSAMTHPILPLLRPKDGERQIELQTAWIHKCFGPKVQTPGFFLPECAYSPAVGRQLDRLGFRWILLDEISADGTLHNNRLPQGGKIRGTKLRVLFRNRKISNTYVPFEVLRIARSSNNNAMIITATDGELYGHHHRDRVNLFSRALRNSRVLPLTASEALRQLPSPAIAPVPSNWESTETDLHRNIPYALWNSPHHALHAAYWEFVNELSSLIAAHPHDPNLKWVLHHFNRGISSCTLWWLSDLPVGFWKKIAWHPGESAKGIAELAHSLRSFTRLPLRDRMKGERRIRDLGYRLWERHWKRQTLPPQSSS